MNAKPQQQAKRSISLPPKLEESEMPRLLRSGSSLNGKISDQLENSLKLPLILSRNGSMKQKENDQNLKGEYEDLVPEQPVLQMMPSYIQNLNDEQDHDLPNLMPQLMNQQGMQINRQSSAASVTRKRQEAENIYYIPQLIKYPSSHYMMPNPYFMHSYDQNCFLPTGGLSRTESKVEPEQQVKKRDSNNSQSHFQQYVDHSKKEQEQIKTTSRRNVNKQKQKQQKIAEKQQIIIQEEKQYQQHMDIKMLEGPCHCTNSGCLKRYCRCFHNGITCGSQCQCEGCKNNDHFHNERSKAMLHVKTKCHRNKKVPKDALFKLKEAYGCNCRKTNCKKNYCECFLRGQECTMDCECENCENGQDEAFQKEIQKKRSISSRRRQLIQ